jgi:RNA 2',3'-cyclic 3'-phosphodiesterase
MRLFVAVEIHPAVAAEAGRVVDVLRTRAQAQSRAARVTWVTADRMHLTVRFIGQVDDGQAAAISEALAAPVAVRPFELTLAGTGAFPPRGAPRVLWAGLESGRNHLLELERAVTARLAPLGIPREDRPYSPHLTLARVREPAGLRTAALLDELTDHAFGTTPVEAITLFESRLSPKGPTYVPLMRSALQAA